VLDVGHRIQAEQATDLAVPVTQGGKWRLVLGLDQRTPRLIA